MPKKSFKDNPALQFISTVEGQEQEQEATTKPKLSTAAKAPEGYKLNPEFVEVKSRRVQLILQPSLYDRVKQKAKAARLSVNEFVHQILEEATREE